MTQPHFYLDHAATSGLRPEVVYAAVDRQMRVVGGAAGRGQHRAAMDATQVLARCRLALAQFLAAPSADCIALTSGCTQSLNFALHGLLRAGDHVVTTAVEHNSLLRPLDFLRRTRGLRVTVVPCDQAGRVAVPELRAAVGADTRMVAISMASNVTGAAIDLAALRASLINPETMLLCDAAQGLGYLPFRLDQCAVDVLAFPGHKGLLGPLGTGGLYVAPRWHAELIAHEQGGTGTASDALEMPAAFPQKLEAGNANVPGFAGLEAAVRHLLDRHDQQPRILERLDHLTRRLWRGLKEIPGVTCWGPDPDADGGARVGVISITVAGWSVQDVAATLDAEFGIACRAGLHCAPKCHEMLGTAPQGTVRFSLGSSSDEADVTAVLEALKQL